MLASSTAFQAGEITAVVVLAVLLIALVRRVMTARPPSDWPRRRVIDALAAGLVAALLIGATVNLGGDQDANSWSSDAGRQTRVDFIAGCNDSRPQGLDCTCVFDRLTSKPPYDTPDGFATLSRPLRAASQSGDISALPPGVVTAVRSCFHAS